MVKYKIEYSKKALKDVQKLKSIGLDKKTKNLIALIKSNPYATSPAYEKLSGDLDGLYSRRINRQHRLVYDVLEDEHIIKILRMWTHYESIVHEDIDNEYE